MGAPGKWYRKGITLEKLFEMFPDEKTAEDWWIKVRWPHGVCCHKCGSTNVQEGTKHPTMRFRCRDCRRYFSAKSGTCMESSKLGYRRWAIAVYLMNSNCKGVSSLKLHRELGITQRSAWFLMHRIREAFDKTHGVFEGAVEVDEAYIGGRNKNRHYRKRMQGSQGGAGKAVVVGIRERETGLVAAKVVPSADRENLWGFIWENTWIGSRRDVRIYTDENRAYVGLPDHGSVTHSRGEYVRGEAHTNGMESFWAMLKRGYHGTYHWMSFKHLQRYVNEFVARNNLRPLDTIEQMMATAAGMDGKRLRYADLVG